MIKNVILDWSGTVVDDLPPVWQATNALLRETGLPEMTLEEFRAEFCLPMEPFYAARMPGISMEQINEGYHRHFPRYGHTVELLPHARGFLEFCHATGRRVFLLSTIHPGTFAEQSARLGVEGLIEKAYTGIPDKREEIGGLLARHGLAVHETLFAGDMVHDIETARSAGVLAVGVLSGFDGAAKLSASGPDVLLRHLGDLQLLMERAEPPGVIGIQGLQIDTCIGVPADERAVPQRLLLDLEITPRTRFSELDDALDRTVDYFALSEAIRAWAAARSGQLIETLAADLRAVILAWPGVGAVRVRVRKFILPYAENVSVTL